jgi:dynein heavy chain
VQEHFKTDVQKLLGHLATEGQALEDENISKLIFGDYMERDPEADPDSDKVYDEVPDMHELLQITEGFLEEYNSNIIPKMDLVLFKFATEHISRISRVLKQPNSHALLIGINGSGRQSFTRLAAFMSGFELVQIEVSQKYGMKEWREDLKNVLKQAGNEGKPTVFLFADEQLKDENLVEDINMLLNTGDLPNIFRANEMGGILDKMQMVARKEFGKKMETSTLTLYNIFIDRVKRNLHIVLAMSPVGDAFRARLRMFPSFINCCTIDWLV